MFEKRSQKNLIRFSLRLDDEPNNNQIAIRIIVGKAKPTVYVAKLNVIQHTYIC